MGLAIIPGPLLFFNYFKDVKPLFFQIRKEFIKMKSDYHFKFMDKKVLIHTDMDTILEMGKLIFI